MLSFVGKIGPLVCKWMLERGGLAMRNICTVPMVCVWGSQLEASSACPAVWTHWGFCQGGWRAPMGLFAGGTEDPCEKEATKVQITHELGPESWSQHQRGGKRLIEDGHIQEFFSIHFFPEGELGRGGIKTCLLPPSLPFFLPLFDIYLLSAYGPSYRMSQKVGCGSKKEVRISQLAKKPDQSTPGRKWSCGTHRSHSQVYSPQMRRGMSIQKSTRSMLT